MEFYRAKLIGKNFQGQDLSGKDFSHADIRGANFALAKLVGTNFSHVKAGLSVVWKITLIIIAVAISLLGGLLAGFSAALISDLWVSNSESFLFGTIALIDLGLLLAIFLIQGLGVSLAIGLGLTAALIATIPLIPDLAADALFTASAIEGSLAGVGSIAFGIVIARLVSFWQPIASTIFFVTVSTIYAIKRGALQDLDIVISTVIALSLIISGTWAGWLAISGNSKYHLIYSLATALVTKGGTNFHRANLTDANFTQAELNSTDFRQAKLTRTNWLQTKHLEKGRLEGTYLADPKIRQLVTTNDGKAENFDLHNLRGLNLQDADLTDASFIGADLSAANLQNADLSRAKLVQTQLYRANLHNACLTGAYIQDWAISTDTIFEAARCEYIYMRLPTSDDPEPWRKPDNRQELFKEGDFADFIAPIIKTLNLYNQQHLDLRQVAHSLKSLDLYHYQGIDPGAAAIAISHLPDAAKLAGACATLLPLITKLLGLP